jgi:hypothetical protein
MSDNKSTSSSSGGIDFFGLLGVLFVALKLLGITEVATWSWWRVTAPFWGSAALVIGLLALYALGALVLAGISALFK